jgi:paraquat-inducible protein B
MTDSIPPVPVAPARRSLLDRVSLIWVVPLAAVLVALGVAWQSYREQGPLIQIEFEDASGIVARETELRYRDVAVGVVERVQFTADLGRVVVSVRVEPGIAPYLDEDAQFWVVRPEITPQRITGLETVLGGVFIAGSWDAEPGETLERFEGRPSSPLLAAGQEGLEFTLRSTDGTLTSTMPLLYKGVTVGQVGRPEVGEDGVSVTAPAVIYAPYDRLVTEATVFWDASGFTLSLGAAGAEVDFASLSSLLVGGLAFDTFVSGATPAQDGDTFEAYLYEASARDAIYADPNSPVLELSAVFTGNVAGLAVGAPVELGGLRVGEVTDVDGLIDPNRFGDDEIHLQAVLTIQPARLGLDGEAGRDEILRILQTRIEEDNLRARLATGSLLGGLKVELVEVEDAPPGAIDLAALPFPALPVADSRITDIAGTAEGLLERVDNLPVEELLDSAIGLFDNASVLIASQDTQAIPGEIRALLGDVRNVTASPEVQALPGQIGQTLGEIDATVTEIRGLLERLRDQQAVERTLAAVDSANQALQSIDAAAQGVPDLVARLDALAVKAQGLEIEPLLAEITGAAADARALINQPGVQTLPNRVSLAAEEATAALTEARAILTEVNAAELGPRLAATLDSARQAALSIETAAEGAPELVERLNSIAARVDALPLDPLVTEATGVATDLRALLQQPGVAELPQRLVALADEATLALNDARGILATVNDADLANRLANAITAGEEAATAVRDGAARLPEIAERAESFIAGLGELPLEELVGEATAFASSANALVSSEATQALPADLSAALAEVQAILAEVRAADVVGNINATLQSARAAADSLPALLERAGGLLDQAGTTLTGFDGTAALVNEAEDAIREVGAAASAVADLARAIERDPNSLIFGD